MFAVRVRRDKADAVMKLAEQHDVSFNDIICELIDLGLESGRPLGLPLPAQIPEERSA